MNYFTITTPARVRCDINSDYPAIVRVDHCTRYETNYDWMSWIGLLSASSMAQLGAKVGKYYSVVSKDTNVIQYFEGVKEYHKTVDNVSPRVDERGNLAGCNLDIDWQTHLNLVPFAFAKVSQKPIAC